MPSVRARSGLVILGVAAGLFSAAASAGTARAAGAADPAVDRGVRFLKARAASSGVGETALIALALFKADVPHDDPAVAACLAKLRARFTSGGFVPERQGGADVYEAGVVALALANLPPSESGRSELGMLARYLASQQKANGSWDYTQRDRGDSSISQYAVLGLWEAENCGAPVAPEVWERAATWFLSAQAPGGSWNYHRDEPNHPETVAMTAAGVGSLLICQRQLARYRRTGGELSPLLVPVSGDPRRARFTPTLSAARVDQAVRRGTDWIAANFAVGDNPTFGTSPYYGLYGIERLGALAGRDNLGRVDWFEQGRTFLHRSQRGDGSWETTYGAVPNTVWAVLFLTRATAKTLARIGGKPLGAGTLLGGRGLPKDLSSLTVAGGRVVSRPMNGAVENMLAALEDPRGENADAALSGLVRRYRSEGPSALKPHKDRFRALLTDRDPGLRRVAAWALARVGDLDAVPALANALTDPDDAVVTVAREGLQLIARSPDGLGPPSPSTPSQRREAAARWRAWYATVRPLDVEGQDEPAGGSAARGPR